MAESTEAHRAPLPVDTTYDPKPTLRYASAVGLQATAVGALASACQNALGAHNKGAVGFFTRTGGTIGFFGAMGFTFAFTEAFVANQRAKNDPLNGVAGGCAAGFLAGLRMRSIPVALGSCAVMGAAIGTFDYAGKDMGGEDPETQEEKRRKFFKQGQPSPVHSSD